MKFWIENRKYYLHLRIIALYKILRCIIGRINALFINNNKDTGIIKLHKWQFKLCKCVTPDDVYIISGAYDKLIKTGVCNGYIHYGIHDDTYTEITNILCNNYKWNEETMFGDRESAIRFSWMNVSPVSIDNIKKWQLAWSKTNIKEL